MEKLNPKELENIKKLSDVRLVSNLTKAGVSQDELDTMDRHAMLNRWAELVVAGAGKLATAVATVAPVTYNVEIEKERLALEKLKLEAQIVQQEKDREVQIRQQEIELAKNRMAQDLEKEKLIIQADLERERLRIEKIKVESQACIGGENNEHEVGVNSNVRKLKQYGDAIRNMVSKMSENTPHEFLPFITKFDQVFETLAVPTELRVSLITPYLSDKCRIMLNQLTGDDASSYDGVKVYLMNQLRLVPSYFVDEFNCIKRKVGETSRVICLVCQCYYDIIYRVVKLIISSRCFNYWFVIK